MKSTNNCAVSVPDKNFESAVLLVSLMITGSSGTAESQGYINELFLIGSDTAGKR